MRLHIPFYRLWLGPIPDSGDALAVVLSDAAWQPDPAHPALMVASLVEYSAPAVKLENLPGLRNLLASLCAPMSRCRLVRVAGAPPSLAVDASAWGLQRARVIVPLMGTGGMTWVSGEEKRSLHVGEVWIVDTWRRHGIVAPTQPPWIYLEADTPGSAEFWDLACPPDAPRPLAALDPGLPLRLEARAASTVMNPWEQFWLIQEVLADLGETAPPAEIEQALQRFHRTWRALWAEHGLDPAGLPLYREARKQMQHTLAAAPGNMALSNGLSLADALQAAVASAALEDAEPPPQTTAPAQAAQPVDVDLRSVHTSSLPVLLKQLGVSVLVSTYQAGKLILLRADGDLLNTHFRNFDSPMGLALTGQRLALGTRWRIWEFQNHTGAVALLEPPGRHDACFLPRWSHATGDIRVHDIAFAGEELWIVNTRFSCLCTLDRVHSFVPRWRPPFITGLAAEDRCHLNGLAVVGDQPRYATALGLTDTAGGWRQNKRDGGVLLEVPSGKPLLRGLSMPHSPRWHDHQLWLLESGLGGLVRADLRKGTWQTVAQLPGFTRGLDFHGPYAFIGLSQVRESATFSGLPITETPRERSCGMWVVDTRNGAIVAFVRFEAGVQEVFAIQVLPNVRFPELLNEDEPLMAESFVLPEDVAEAMTRVGK